MLVDMPWIVGSRYPASHCIHPATGAAMGRGIGHACQKIYIILICILLLFYLAHGALA